MDPISYGVAAKQKQRIEKVIAEPDSTSGVITVPQVIATGETITVPAGRVAILPNIQVDGTLNVEGEVFIPSGATASGVVEKVTSTDNAIVRFDGTSGAVQNSSVIVDDTGGISSSSSINGLYLRMIDTVNAHMLYLRYLGGYNRLDSYNYPITNATPMLINSSTLMLQINDSTKVILDSNGNLNFYGGEVLQKTAYGLGYGTGSGGTVTQLTSKSTAVTLNKPSGYITMNNAALAAGASVAFIFNNSIISYSDQILITRATTGTTAGYNVWIDSVGAGACTIAVKNITGVSLSEAIVLSYSIIKGAIA